MNLLYFQTENKKTVGVLNTKLLTNFLYVALPFLSLSLFVDSSFEIRFFLSVRLDFSFLSFRVTRFHKHMILLNTTTCSFFCAQ
jgi:hypothetical protein